MSNDDTILQQIQDLTVAGAGGAPLPFEQAPPRVVSVPYTSTAVMGGTDVQYQFGPDAAKFVRESDLRPLDNVRFPSSQGQLQAMRRFEYKGNLLVDEKNQLARPQYDVRSEPLGLLRSLGSNASRLSILNTLYQKGFYSSGKPSSNGMSGQDQNAMANLLEYANAMGRTYNVALLEVQSFENERGLGGAASVRVTAKEDVREYANKDALELLGRTLTRQEFRQVLQQVYAQERGAAGRGEQQATLGTLTSQAIQQVAPREVQMNDAADAIDIFRAMLRGG
jgi:hypothetical protein